ncbi:hypothetical protein J3F84DRAFT_354999 [Trichoderma pleuroticola]
MRCYSGQHNEMPPLSRLLDVSLFSLSIHNRLCFVTLLVGQDKITCGVGTQQSHRLFNSRMQDSALVGRAAYSQYLLVMRTTRTQGWTTTSQILCCI